MINAAIQDEVEAVQGAGNQGRGKDIATIVNAEKEEAQVKKTYITYLLFLHYFYIILCYVKFFNKNLLLAAF